MHVKLITRLFAVFLLGFVSFCSAANHGLPVFTGLVKDNGPAVVNISTRQHKTSRRGMPPGFQIPDLPDENPLSDLLRHFFEKLPEEQRNDGGQFDSRSLGSGFIISADGYVITNHHVIKDADEVMVRLSDRREFKATVIGSDRKSDIALLKIDASGLPVVKIGKSSVLEVGEWVLAIGSPFGFDHSVTAGIVSAKGRSLPRENYVPFIQTDVAINPGNSGGPLFNLAGEVVGVNSQIYSRTGGFMGLSFSIPIEMAMNVVSQLKQSGHVSRGWLGVMIQDVNKDLAASFGMQRPQGALVSQVVDDGPGDVAGLLRGDVILRFAGQVVPNSAALPPMVGGSPIGEGIVLDILRAGKQQQVKVHIGALPGEDSPRGQFKKTQVRERFISKRLGITVGPQRNPTEPARLQVLDVKDGVAARGGVRKHDVIVMMDGKTITDIDMFKTLVQTLPAHKIVAMLVRREGNPLFLAFQVPAS